MAQEYILNGAFVSAVLTLFALTTVSYDQSTKSAQTAQRPNVTAEPGGMQDFPYKFGGVDYEFMIVPMPNGTVNGMIYKFNGGKKE